MTRPPAAGAARAPAALLAGVLLHVLLYGLTLPRPVDWDGLAFLLQAPGYRFTDPAHLLYPALLGVLSPAAGALGLDPALVAAVFSAACAAVAFLMLHRLLAALGTPSPCAVLAAALVTTAPALWRAAVGVEVYTPALAALLAAGCAAARFARTRRAGWLALAALLLLVAAGCHVAALAGAPFLAVLTASKGRPPLRPLAVAGAGLVAAGAVAWAGGAWQVGELVARARAFLPAGLARDPAAQVLENGARAVRFLVELAPVLATCGAAGLGLLLAARARGRAAVLSLLLPFLGAWLLLGVPLLALLLPVLPALGLAAGLAARRLPRGAGTALLGVALALQVALALPRRWEEARKPDPRVAEARRLAAAQPPRTTLVAGRLAYHLRYHTRASVVPLADVLHAARTREGTAADPAGALRGVVRARLDAGDGTVFITRDALELLHASGVPVREGLSLLASGDPVWTDPVRPDLRVYVLAPPERR